MTEFVRSSVDRLLYTSFGQILISAIFGLAVALLFHRVCKSGCIVYYAPHIDEVQDKVFQLEDTCYKYTPYVIPCKQNQEILNPYDVNDEPINKIQKVKSYISEN